MKTWLFPFCNYGFKTTLRLFSDCQVEGKENIPGRGPVIFVANHLSNLDPAIVAAVSTRSPRFLAKKEIFKYAPLAFLLRSYGAHPLDRVNVDRRALKWAVKQLQQPNGALALFPEGTRDKTGQGMRRGLPGVTQVSLLSGAPIIPIGLTGSEPLQNMFKVLKPTATLRIKVGPLFRIDSGGEKRLAKEEVRAATDEIMVRIARLLPESYRGYYRDKVDMPMVHTTDVQAQAPVMASAQA